VCQPEQKSNQRALSLRVEGGRLLTFCHKSGCTFRDVLNAAGRANQDIRVDMGSPNLARIERGQYDAQQLAKARQLWVQGKQIHGTKGEAYLRIRGITCEMPSALRWVPDTYHSPSARWLSAIVADVSSGGIHRTFFEKTGARLTKNARLMQGPCAGGAVHLVDAPEGPLVVAEGIETALSLASGLLKTSASIWAALSTSGMRGVILPIVPGQLIVAADGDIPGLNAAQALAERAEAEGWNVSLLAAPDGCDWNDVLTGKGGAS
jgi:phage/plasmid primase-like uncharacterized protein